MNEIVKDVAEAAEAGMSMQSRLILMAGGAAVLLAVALGIAHHFENRGRTLERAVWVEKENRERIADAALIAKHAAEDAALQAQHEATERKISEDHAIEIAELRRERDADRLAVDRAGGLRIPAPACAPDRAAAAADPAGAGGRDEPAGTATVRLPQPVEDGLWRLADDADEVSAQLRACQAFVRANGFYGPAPAENTELLGRMIASPNHATEESHD